MNHRQRLALIAWFVPGTSITLPAGLLLLKVHEPEPVLAAGGIAFLSLPAGLLDQGDPLAGWEALEFDDPAPGPVIPASEGEPVAETEATAPPGTELQVELFGHVSEGEQQVFCFLDRRCNRWFRLVAGGIDTVAQVALLEQRGGNWPLLLDLMSGRTYLLEPGRSELVPFPDDPSSTNHDE